MLPYSTGPIASPLAARSLQYLDSISKTRENIVQDSDGWHCKHMYRLFLGCFRLRIRWPCPLVFPRVLPAQQYRTYSRIELV